MMKFFISILFLTPLCYYKLGITLVQYWYLFLYLLLMVSGCFSFFSKISFFMGLDSFSLGLILLSFLISSFMIISMMNYTWINMFMFLDLLLLVFLILIFGSMNFLYMYISFEFVLIPLLIIILGWGYQPERLLAGMYLFFYTMLVSLPLFIVIMYMYMCMGSLFLDLLKFNSCSFILHFVIMLVFLVKMPMYFVHFWLPKAHVQAPVAGSMILAGIMLKIGGYGLIRTMYMFEYMFMNYSYVWFSISMLGSFYISLICLIQSDIKSLIAYSSVAHMGMVIMGIMTMSSWGLLGSYLLMLGHGFCSSAMFYMANVFYIRTKSRSFYINKGLINYLPSSSMFWFMFCSFNMSCPPSINFISELMIISSMMNFWFSSMYFFIGISFFCASFSYYLYSFSQHGLYSNMYSFSSINLAEYLVMFMHMIPLIGLSIFISVLV
uniref:NADH dehydrogenase subunit 4 n=1 Tax=Doratura stylata TaxID=139543 RepID=UPI002029933D|nr:NADH dehydrogenase subunit 4 [Doratura stylata]UPU95804.1 NADH dehydrogenase subunit 4 [Doratura stylata]UXD78647.1 NADH dehydrogenase subunit 4 [Doratura stylata]